MFAIAAARALRWPTLVAVQSPNAPSKKCAAHERLHAATARRACLECSSVHAVLAGIQGGTVDDELAVLSMGAWRLRVTAMVCDR